MTARPWARRDLLEMAALGGAALLAPRWSILRTPGARAGSRLADSRIDLLLDEPIGTIAPEIYGHFTEHLGGVIYNGVWVGENSKIPNIGGIRKALVDALKPITPSILRWPGGCFADSYDWRDGVGPRAQRPRRNNFWSDDPAYRALGNIPAKYDPNAFGTSEFLHFCRLIGAQPYLAANVRSLPALVFTQWLEYCNAPAGSTSWADVRAAGGDREPFGVRYWGVGNESWGCGGNFTPEDYASEFRRFGVSAPEFGVDLQFIASGPNGGDLEWTRRFFGAMAERNSLDMVKGWALHHYSSAGDAGADAVTYDERGWYDLVTSCDRMEGLITSHWQEMARADRGHRIKLVVDEWGAWHRTAPVADPSHLFESQSTMRDAVVAGLTLDTFNRHADKVAMANVAQLINCIHSLFLSHEEQLVVTPTYHVFAMYAAHQGARALRSVVSTPPLSWQAKDGTPRSQRGLNCSASIRDRTVILTVTNPALKEARTTEITLRGGTIRAAKATILASADVHAVNTFERPDTITPTVADIAGSGESLVVTFLPASVTRLELALGT
jgi:alpha-N-arabinofuranosidase